MREFEELNSIQDTRNLTSLIQFISRFIGKSENWE